MRLAQFYLSFAIFIVGVASLQHANALGLPPFYDTEDAVKSIETRDDVRSVTLTISDHPIHLTSAGKASSPAVLFIHGSPGSWDAWAEYLDDAELRDKAFMIAVDRPGFGGSNNGTSGLSLKEQSRLIIEAVKEFTQTHKTFIVVGHSYGGPLALRLAIDYPQHVQSTILLAPAIAPDLVKVKWYNKLADLLLIRAILPRAVHHSNEEMLLLKSEVTEMSALLDKVKAPTSIIQGGKDWLVPPGNADFAVHALKNATVAVTFLPDQGHFIPWKEYDLVKKTLMEHIAGLRYNK